MRTVVLVAIGFLVVWSMLRGAEVDAPEDEEHQPGNGGMG